MALVTTRAGLFCPVGGFHVDPWRPVARSVVTHAHSDHARPGSKHYHAASPGVALLRRRLGEEAVIEGHGYGEPFRLGDATLSLHPAGHVLGSAQVRIEVAGEVFVVTGDYKRAFDPSCAPFELVRCDVLVTEATFGLPIYRWDPVDEVVGQLIRLWDRTRDRPVAVFAYALGKAQRLLAEIAARVGRPVHVHGAIDALLPAYRDAGIELGEVVPVAGRPKGRGHAGELVLAPPSAFGSPWLGRLGDPVTVFASGWMRVRGQRRRRGFDAGLVLSDHVDWPGLLQTVRETGARRVLVTHGYAEAVARHLAEQGLDASPLATRFEGETD
jgi:putative mRNA 3-end processing factor